MPSRRDTFTFLRPAGEKSPPGWEKARSPAPQVRCGTTVNIFRDLLLQLSLTGCAAVLPKHGLHDGETALTLIF